MKSRSLVTTLATSATLFVAAGAIASTASTQNIHQTAYDRLAGLYESATQPNLSELSGDWVAIEEATQCARTPMPGVPSGTPSRFEYPHSQASASKVICPSYSARSIEKNQASVLEVRGIQIQIADASRQGRTAPSMFQANSTETSMDFIYVSFSPASHSSSRTSCRIITNTDQLICKETIETVDLQTLKETRVQFRTYEHVRRSN